MNLEVELPEKYKARIGYDKILGLYVVWGDYRKQIRLGSVETQHKAMKLLDGYDAQLNRMEYIAKKVLADQGKLIEH